VERTAVRRLNMVLVTAACAAAAAGCGGGMTEPLPPPRAQTPTQISRPASPSSNRPEGEYGGRGAATSAEPKVSSDTERDAKFARFLQKNSAGMIREAAVGLENRGELRVEITRAVEPEETLPLTKSLMAGARADFPDRPITLSLFDPNGAPILKARYTPGEGISYKIAHGGTAGEGKTDGAPAPSTARKDTKDPLARGGVTQRDQKFSAWAEEHGKSMLRYVESDLEGHGRLWFGVTRQVKPADVRPLTQSLLEGAAKEFPRKELVATVFDPDGERIGRAHLGRGGEVSWEK